MIEIFGAWISDLLLPARRRLSELDGLVAAATRAHVAARRALAIAAAEEEREVARRAAFADKARDLEARALGALAGGREDLAARAAEAIATIETEVAASEAASVRFGAKVAATRREVDAQRRRLADLERGRRLAKVGAALDVAGSHAEGVPLLARAEAALERVEAGQHDAEAVRMELAPPAQSFADNMLADDMAEAGFGRQTRVLAVDVMTRLRARSVAAVAHLPEA